MEEDRKNEIIKDPMIIKDSNPSNFVNHGSYFSIYLLLRDWLNEMLRLKDIIIGMR